MTTPSGDLLDSQRVLDFAPQLLPASANQVPAPTAALALLVHALHVRLGFRLDPPRDGNVLPDDWLASKGDYIALRYRHEQSSMVFELNITRVGGRAVVNAIAVEVSLSFLFAPLRFRSTDNCVISFLRIPDRTIKLSLWMCLCPITFLQPLFHGLRLLPPLLLMSLSLLRASEISSPP
jgi:hypothetical protein